MAKTKDEDAPETPAATPVAAQTPVPGSLEDRKAKLLEHVKERLGRAGMGDGVIAAIVGVDKDEHGAVVSVESDDMGTAVSTATMLLAGQDGREWTWQGTGPNLETGKFRAFVHASF